MAVSSGSGAKIDALRQAATQFVNYVYADPVLNSLTKVALVPFSASVAVDPQAFSNANWVDTSAQSSLHRRNITGATAAGFKSKFDIFAKLGPRRP